MAEWAKCLAESTDVARCNSEYNTCKTDCGSIDMACALKNVSTDFCTTAKNECEKKIQCKDQYDICKQNASTGWEGLDCYNEYKNCLLY